MDAWLLYRSLFVVSLSALGLKGLHVDKLTAVFTLSKYYSAINQSIDGVILAHAYIQTGMVNSTTLTLDDVTGFSILTAKNLNSESFAL